MALVLDVVPAPRPACIVNIRQSVLLSTPLVYRIAEMMDRAGAIPEGPMTDDSEVIAYLKRTGVFDTFAQAAGVAKSMPAVADVHVPTAIGNEDDKEKAAPVVVIADPSLDNEEAADVAKAAATYAAASRAAAAADPVFFAKADTSLYAYRPLTPGSAQRLHDWAVAQGIPNVVPADLLHTTIVHSKTPVDPKLFQPEETIIDIAPTERWMGALGDKGALVMFFRSLPLVGRHAESRAAGAVWDFPTFIPHITLSYDAGPTADNAGMIEPPDFPIQLGPEVFRASDENWVEDNKLRKGDFNTTVKVAKVDADQQLIFGWASVSMIGGQMVIDKQGDMIPVDEIEKAAYDYTLWSRTHGEMHALIGTGNMVESCVFTPEKAALGLIAKNDKGEQLFGWWVGFKVSNPDTWAAHKRGELPEFSIGGRATPVEI